MLNAREILEIDTVKDERSEGMAEIYLSLHGGF